MDQGLDFDVFDKLLDGVAVVATSGQILYANDAFFSIFDLPVARTKKAKSILDIFTFENLDVPIKDIFASGAAPSHYVETNFSTKYGKKGIVQIGFQHLEKQNAFILFFRDVALESRLQAKYRLELAEKDRKIHEISLLRDMAILLVGLTDEDSIVSRILEKWMTVGNCEVALFLKTTEDKKTRRLFVIDRKESLDGTFLDIPYAPEIDSLLGEDWDAHQAAGIHEKIQNAFRNFYDLKRYNISTAVPVKGKDSKLGLLILFKEYFDENLTTVEDVSLLRSVLAQMAVALEGAQYFESSIVDAMTRLYNKGYFESRFASELSRAKRESNELALLICDIDHFKKVNDTYGHAVGDLVLKNVAQHVKGQCRATDLPARYGGEEFCVILSGTGESGAVVFAERLRKIVESSSVADKKTEIKVTISLGVAIFPTHGGTEKEIFANADKALYDSKSKGRNRLTIYQP